jgi:hypothetical protein
MTRTRAIAGSSVVGATCAAEGSRIGACPALLEVARMG